jgi:hypothetical protein
MAGPGRPSSYTEEIAREICYRLAGGESLRAICRDAHMPPEPTVRLWVLDDREGFSAQYTRARELQALSLADELLEIVDDGRNDWMKRNGGDANGYELNGEHIQRSKLRITTRMWHLSKILPKVYGDKTEIAHTGPSGGPIQNETKMSIDPVEASRAYVRFITEDK